MVKVLVLGSSCRLIPRPSTIRFAQLLCLVLIWIHLPLFCYGSSSHLNVSSCPEHERQALLDMLPGGSDSEGDFFGTIFWVGTNCCQWLGIACDRRTGHVVRIDLRPPPYFGNRLNLPNSLLALKHLRYLDLSGNMIFSNASDGLYIPGFIGSFQNLRYLNLSSTFSQGDVVPHQLGNLSRLRTVSLGSIYGITIQIDDPSWLSHLTNLSVLDLSGVEIENSTVPSWLSSLTRLQYLRLSNCNLGGEALWNLSSSLEVLDLSSNQLQGSIPYALGSMSMLRELNLSGNNFSGSVPHSLGRLSRLVFLDLSRNSLTGTLTEAHFANLSSLKHLVMTDMNSPIVLNVSSDWQPPFHLQDALLSGGCQVARGRFPRWLRFQLQSLSTLDMSNTGIEDSVPGWFWIDNGIVSLNLSHNSMFGDLPPTLQSPRLETIDLSSNRLHGPLPQHFITPNLSFLDLSINSFSGPISNIGTSNLKYLLLSNNSLTGKVPAFICRQDGLLILDLSENHLTGELPDCPHPVFFQASVLDLSGNYLSGRIPDNLGSHNCRLTSLYLSNNKFSGELPSSLSKCEFLNVLDLAYNEFTGNIAIWLGNNMSNLKTLRLRSNNFYGLLPPMLSQFELKILDLSYNNLSGAIPPSYGSFWSMMTLNISGYDGTSKFFADRVLLWMKGKEQTYDKMLILVIAIDLSHNDLSGTIPEQLASLISLQSLNLSNNNLTGEITTKIGQMQQLESLDLSYNRLSGHIPPSLANLSSLGYLDLSFNNLSGRIPTGGHLDTFQDASVYMGNPYIDSVNVIIEKHRGDKTIEGASVGENTDEGIDEKFWLYISIAPGFVVGIWAVLGPLLFKKAWRYAYFRAMDTLHDKILCR